MSYFNPYIGVVGSRTFTDYAYLHAKLHELIDGALFQRMFSRWPQHKAWPFGVVSGGAKGADKLAEKFAIEHNLALVVFRPDWEKYGKSAGYKRNKQIVDEADIIVAFWDGESKGTKHSIDLAVEQNKHVYIYTDWTRK